MKRPYIFLGRTGFIQAIRYVEEYFHMVLKNVMKLTFCTFNYNELSTIIQIACLRFKWPLWYNDCNKLSKNMRNKKTFRYALLLAALAPFLAFSVTLAVESARPMASEKRMQDDDSMRMKEDSRKNEMMEKRRMSMMNISGMMGSQVNRAEKAIKRLDDIMKRVQTRRDKLAAMEGVNLTDVDAKIATASAKKQDLVDDIADAKKKWDAFKAAMTAQTSAFDAASDAERSSIRALGKDFMDSMKDVNASLKAFHKSLSDAVRAMMKAVPKPDSSATNN